MGSHFHFGKIIRNSLLIVQIGCVVVATVAILTFRLILQRIGSLWGGIVGGVTNAIRYSFPFGNLIFQHSYSQSSVPKTRCSVKRLGFVFLKLNVEIYRKPQNSI